MGELPQVFLCDKCRARVNKTQAQFHLSSDGNALAWDHRIESNGKCRHYSPLCNTSGAPIEASARFANHLNVHGSVLRMTVVDTKDTLAYYVSDAHDLLWVSATVVAPVGLEPVVTVSTANPRLSTMLSSVPLGVLHEGDVDEYRYLRLGVGDWLVVSRDEPTDMRKMTDANFQALLREAGVIRSSVAEVRRVVTVS